MSKLIICGNYSLFEYNTVKRDAIADIYHRGYLRFKDKDKERARRYFDKYWERLVSRTTEIHKNLCFLDKLNHTKTSLIKEEFECEMYYLILAASKFVERYQKYIPRFRETALKCLDRYYHESENGWTQTLSASF